MSIVLKLGTRVVTHLDGRINTEFLQALVAQMAPLFFFQGHRFIVVTSGAVAHGRSVCASPNTGVCAAVGQAALMGAYQQMFGAHSITVAQVLVTEGDLNAGGSLVSTLEGLFQANIIPIVNENDVVTYGTASTILPDNDVLAATVANLMGARRLIILTDVDGVKPTPASDITLSEVRPCDLTTIVFGTDHKGRGGMASKVAACLSTKKTVCLIGNYTRLAGAGSKSDSGVTLSEVTLSTLIKSDALFPHWTRCLPDTTLRPIASVDFAARKNLVADILAALPCPELWAANAKDTATLSNPRAHITPDKLRVVSQGILDYMKGMTDPLERVLNQRTIYHSITLTQVTVPLGRIFIIFEARPDVIPQVVALSLLAGNELVLKGGTDTARTNGVMYRTIERVLAQHGVILQTVTHCETREDAQSLLLNPGDISLVIPRGGAELVRWVQEHSRIPVLAHADGVCHVYVHARANLKDALKVIVDAKLQYSAVCNAAETLLLDRALQSHPDFREFLDAVEAAGCLIQAGPDLYQDYPHYPQVEDFHCEYGDARLTVEWVPSLEAAITHINTHSSHHTDCIVTEDVVAARTFQQRVTSASVFHNVSTRFADGRRFGLGAEIGISTSKIHARGPVGIEGLVTTQYRATATVAQAVGDYE